MKNQLIGALVASIILFVWQFLSWSPILNVHSSQMQYTPSQDTILQALNEAGLSEGQYFIPRAPETAPEAESNAYMNERVGKPWAMVSYHSSMSGDMSMNMIRGWVVDFIAAFLLCWLLLKMAKLDFKTSILSSLAVGLIGYFTINYLDSIWFEGNSIPYLIDAVVQWGLVGLWLGWWLPGRT